MSQSNRWTRALPAAGLLATLVLALFALSARPVSAAGILVNSAADTTISGDGECTLREAILNANSDSDTTGGDCAAGSGADEITFAADYVITLITGSQLPVVTSASHTFRLRTNAPHGSPVIMPLLPAHSPANGRSPVLTTYDPL